MIPRHFQIKFDYILSRKHHRLYQLFSLIFVSEIPIASSLKFNIESMVSNSPLLFDSEAI